MNPALLALILTQAQANWLTVAYDEGSKYGLPRYTQAIILTESSGCAHKVGDDGTSWGCGQLKLETARKFCQCDVSVRELRTDNKRNIGITARYLSACFERFWPDKERAIFCYSRGIPKASKASHYQIIHAAYVKRVKSYIAALEEIPIDGR